jgi:peroxin-7
MPMFKTAFNGYSVKFSPFLENRLAVSTSENFGIVGTGRQHILDVTPNGMVQIAAFDTPDGLYDCAWSEDNENVLVSASGDGSIKVFDLSAPPRANPVSNRLEHAHEVASVDWNVVRKDSFLSSSWDDTIRLWTLDVPHSIRTFAEHSYCVYNATWNPRHADIFASASGDCTLRVWDVRQPRSTYVIPGHEMEILSCDWNKYNEFMLASGSVDKSIKVWDVRNPRQELTRMMGHTYAVRRVKFSPHQESMLASCSYDMTVCLWDFRQPEDALLARLNHHSEFAVGIDMSVLVEGLLASTAWDESVFVWQMGMDPRAL